MLHGRNRDRADEALSKVPGALTAVVGDLASIAETKSLADQVNELGPFDAVIHNAGIYLDPHGIRTVDGLPQIFAVNSLAPYILTCLIRRPKRLVYTSSGLHRSGDASLNDLTWSSRPWDGSSAYADSKLHNVILAFAVARKWPDVLSNAVDPGWAATKMGGPGAPVSVEEGVEDAGVAGSEPGQGSPGLGKIFLIINNPGAVTRLPRIRLSRKSIFQHAAACPGSRFPADTSRSAVFSTTETQRRREKQRILCT